MCWSLMVAKQCRIEIVVFLVRRDVAVAVCAVARPRMYIYLLYCLWSLANCVGMATRKGSETG